MVLRDLFTNIYNRFRLLMLNSKLTSTLIRVSRRHSIELLAILIVFSYAQMVLSVFKKSEAEDAKRMIETLLNKNDISANPYRVAQEIENLETLGVANCARLSVKSENILFTDTSYKVSCYGTPFFFGKNEISTDILSVSGQIWHIEANIPLKTETKIFISLLLILGALLAFAIARLYRWRIERVIHLKNMEISRIEGISLMARQVAHDIRSPLSALNLISSDLNEIAQEKRHLMQCALIRINDIASDLLIKGQTAHDFSKFRSLSVKEGKKEETEQEIVLLPVLINSIIKEKCVLLRDQSQLRIISDFDNNEEVFVRANGKELQRVVSNLLNNSIEAMQGRVGCVTVAIRSFQKVIQLIIKDDGCGIPEQILHRLGEVGVTLGKSGKGSGHGLGVAHARKAILSFGAKFNIQSQLNVGTQVDIRFLRLPKPT